MKITHCLASVALVSMLGACSGVQNSNCRERSG